MLDDLDSADDIRRLTRKLLGEADAEGRFPTPVADLVAAANLVQPADSVLSKDAIESAPAHLRDAIRKLRYKVQALLDRQAREIHVNPEIQHDGQRRFKELHEVSHHLFPWQDARAYADDDYTLSPKTSVLFEQEANQGGAELLFQGDLFATLAQDYEIGFGAVIELSEKFGGSIHASFRRYVETHKSRVAGLVLDPSPCQKDPVGYRRHEALCSKSWTERYERPSSWPYVVCAPPFSFIDSVARAGGIVPPRLTMTYPDLNNSATELEVSLFTNSYKVFVLIWAARSERFKRKRIVVPTPEASDIPF